MLQCKQDTHRQTCGKIAHLNSDFCCLLLSSAHQVALLGVEGWHGLQAGAQPMAGGLEQLLRNLLRHLSLLSS